MSVFVNRFRKGFRLDTYIYWMTEWDASVDEGGNQIYIPLQIIQADRGIAEETKLVTSCMI